MSECFISHVFSKSTLFAYRLKELLPKLVTCPLLTGSQTISKYRLLVMQCTLYFMYNNETWRQQCSRDQHFFYHYRGVIHSHHAIYFLSAHIQQFCSGMQWKMLLYLISFKRFPPEQMIAIWYKMLNIERHNIFM